MYALSQAWRAIRANWVASVATLATMLLSLTILSGFSLLTLNLNETLSTLQDELMVTVYLQPEADTLAILSSLQTWPEIASAALIDKEQGLNELQKILPSVGVASDLVGNPLPDRIDMRLLDPALTPQVRVKLEALSGLSKIQDGSQSVETFIAINESVRVIGSILIVILLTSSLFAIVNSIRAAITARRNEIEVMRLVGATRGFIRAPFLIEGFLLGLFSALITLALVVPGYRYVTQRLSEQLVFIPLVRDVALLSRVALLLFALALLVGLVGSAISVSQYLREEV
jgi:cell division transport system permease protein